MEQLLGKVSLRPTLWPGAGPEPAAEEPGPQPAAPCPSLLPSGPRIRPGPAARGPLLGAHRGGRATPARNFEAGGDTVSGPLPRPRRPSATLARAP